MVDRCAHCFLFEVDKIVNVIYQSVDPVLLNYLSYDKIDPEPMASDPWKVVQFDQVALVSLRFNNAQDVDDAQVALDAAFGGRIRLRPLPN